MSEDGTLLSFEDVYFPASPPEYAALEGVGFDLPPGGAAALAVSSAHVSLSLGDLACGIAHPEKGRVLFDGNDWSVLSPGKAGSLRGGITRVFESRGWINNLDIDENIMLPSRHHTKRPCDEIRAEAECLAKDFGLGGLPSVRPAFLSPGELKKWEWVRALLGAPRLVVMEYAFRHVKEKDYGLLIDAVEKKRAAGTAVVWLESEHGVLRRLSELEPDVCMEIGNE